MHKILSILNEYMMNIEISYAYKTINTISLHIMFLHYVIYSLQNHLKRTLSNLNYISHSSVLPVLMFCLLEYQ